MMSASPHGTKRVASAAGIDEATMRNSRVMPLASPTAGTVLLDRCGGSN